MRKKTPKQEWDWPPQRPREGEFVDAVPRRTGWGSPTATKIANAYIRTVWFIFKIVFAAILSVFLIGLIWIMSAMMRQ